MDPQLRLRPETIPELRRAYQDALERLRPALAGGADPFGLDRPALGDPAGLEFERVFDRYAGSLADQVSAFERRLLDALDTLTAIQRAYDRHETATAAALSRRLEP